MGNGAIDFSSIGGQSVAPSAPASLDFSSIGGQRVDASSAPSGQATSAAPASPSFWDKAKQAEVVPKIQTGR
jgi:hypothetical protein